MKVIDDRETYDVANVSGGIQSTTLAHAIFNNDMPRPDCFIFADTGWERQSSYETVEGLKILADEHDIPFHVANTAIYDCKHSKAVNPIQTTAIGGTMTGTDSSRCPYTPSTN